VLRTPGRSAFLLGLQILLNQFADDSGDACVFRISLLFQFRKLLLSENNVHSDLIHVHKYYTSGVYQSKRGGREKGI
jgi:hypothetical protein